MKNFALIWAVIWALIWTWIWVAADGSAAEATAFGTDATIRDFLTQDVCVDWRDGVLDGVSPVDGDPRCVRHRDLTAGEALPYHKHDHPSPAQRESAPRGYQRHDSVPIDTAQFGVVIEHSFDFGAGQGRQFGVFDEGGGDGGDIAILSTRDASIAATQDGGAGFQLFTGPACVGVVTADGLRNSWLIAAIDAAKPLAGSAVARLKDIASTAPAVCPARLDDAYTSWRVEPFRYRSAPGQGMAITLPTLISEHFAGADPARARNMERFYYTRELGSTRWERWESPAGAGADEIRRRAEAFADTQRCGTAPPPERNRALLMIDCREWTRTVPPDRPEGDPPGFFIDFLEKSPGKPRYFTKLKQ